ncbi:MAG: site-2 protease family protein [Aeromicrobium sp.]|uniref:site-2 protease family protein n=1 Tax=Aeromicrobium sp. TaxID=1871063 RepID=UPI0039E53BC5
MVSPTTLRVGRLWSAPLLVRPGALVMAGLLVVVLATRFDALGEERPWLVAAAAVAALFVSLLLHEAAHVAAARFYRAPVESVTLHLMGGETLVAASSATPRQELVTAGSGPLASILLGLSGLGAAPTMTDGTLAARVVEALGWVNLVVAAVNLLPAAPLDGGRMLRALGWAATGDERKGLVIAARCGQIGALAATAVGAWLLTRGGLEVWLHAGLCGLLAVFMWQGSSQSLRRVDRARRVEALDVRSLFEDAAPDAGWPSLSVEARGSDLLRAMACEPSDAYAVVDLHGTVLGTLRTETVNRAYRAGAR